MSSEVLPSIEMETGHNPTAAVIWLHGLGADGNDFVPIVGEMRLPATPAIRFVFPHAPVRPVTLNNGFRMRAWYDIAAGDITSRADVAGVRESQGHVEALIAREKARGIVAKRIVLAGFSQGGVVALHTGVRHPERLAGIVALSTYLPLQERTAAERSTANASVPIFMAHGSVDPVVPQALGSASRDALAALGYDVAWHSYPMAHQVCAQEIADLQHWIGARLAAC